jgi:hypothetical protein
MKTVTITMRTYIVEVEGYGPGLITFLHKGWRLYKIKNE